MSTYATYGTLKQNTLEYVDILQKTEHVRYVGSSFDFYIHGVVGLLAYLFKKKRAVEVRRASRYGQQV